MANGSSTRALIIGVGVFLYCDFGEDLALASAQAAGIISRRSRKVFVLIIRGGV